MNRIDRYSIADIDFELQWHSRIARHTERYAARGVNFWRDWFPEKLRQELTGRWAGDTFQVALDPADLFGESTATATIDRRRFSKTPRIGRFYPKGCLSGFAGIFPQNIQPFRCVGLPEGKMVVDLSHPLAQPLDGGNLDLSVSVAAIGAKQKERGGTSSDWVGLLTDGPGMQSRWPDTPTDFFSDQPFARADEQSDSRFYGSARLVHHLDRTARQGVTDLYRRFVSDGMRVLDLMSSWVSHLPEEVHPAAVAGLGMNAAELAQNPRLSDRQVRDLNADPRLPYPAAAFDAVICTVSVEYLTGPREVFAEVRRVLAPGGIFVVVFSNRWFPPKVVRIWEELHEFERMGLVLEYFLRCGGFEQLETLSSRGLPRPADDKYANQFLYSDPLYAVWGRRSLE